MPKQTIEAFENRTTKRILTGAAIAAVLAGVGIRMNQLNNGDDLGRAQQRADHPTNPDSHSGIPGFSVKHSVESDK